MAIGRVAGPMLLSELDRQGIDLTFTTNSAQLVNLDFTNFRMALKGGSGGAFVFNVNGNAAIANVVLENSGNITTQGLNQTLTLKANGVANVTVINANVISGRVDGTVIGGLNPVPGTFTFLNANVLGTFATANVSNLRANLVAFTAPNNQIIIDNPTLRFYNANNSLVVDNLTVLQSQVFTTLDAANVIIRNSNPTSIAYIAANNWVVTTTNLRFFNSNSLIKTGNLQLDNAITNQLLYVASGENNKVKGTDYLTFDGFNLRANGVTRLGDATFFSNQISTANTNQDLLLNPSGSGVISAEGHFLRNLPSPVQATDAATKQYVDGIISINTTSTNSIFAGDSRVQVLDDNLFTANIVFYVNGYEEARIESGKVTLQDLYITNDTIYGSAGAIRLEPYNSDRVVVETNKALTIPVGNVATRPTPGFESVGDLRFNTEVNSIEWYSGTGWDTPITNVVNSQTIVPDGTNASFTLNQVCTTESVLVNFNGVIQRPSATYSVAGNIITFTTVPLTTDIIELRFFTSAMAVATNPIVVDMPYSNVAVTTTTIDQFYSNVYRGAKYTYTARTTAGQNVELGEIKLVHDDVTAFLTSSFVSKTGTSCVSFSAVVDLLGVVRLRAIGSNSDVKIKYHATYLSDPTLM